MKTYAFRLQPGKDLKTEIELFAKEKRIDAGVLLSVVGGLEKAVLRMAGSEPKDQIFKTWDEPLEIVGGTGTISQAGCHIHISVSTKHGLVFGGHLRNDCLVKYTAEIVIGVLDGIIFERIMDDQTGFKELVVYPKGVNSLGPLDLL